MNILGKISDWIVRLSEMLSAFFVGSMVVVVFTQVFLRFVFNSGIPWADQYARFSTIWAVMIIANVAIKEDKLVKVDFLDEFWPEKFIKARDRMYQIILLIILSLLLFQGWINAIDGFKSTIPGLKISWFWVYLSIPVGALLMIYQYLYRFFLSIKKEGEIV